MYRQVSAISLLLLAVAATPLNAFDTGHHADLTRAALSRRGFSEDAIKTVQVANWLTDYYQVPVEKLEGPGLNLLNPHPAALVHKVEDLHFDNLDDVRDVQRYWWNLAANTKRLARDATRKFNEARNQPAKQQKILQELLMVLGMSLHAAQDFYSHSNWVEEHAQHHPPQYETTTWWVEESANMGNMAGRVPLPDYHTGWYRGWRNLPEPQTDDRKHGTYADNPPAHFMNHDSYCRPRWDQAYVFAYAATVEWIDAVMSWAQPPPGGGQGPFTNVAAYAVGTQGILGTTIGPSDKVILDRDLRASKWISEWVTKPNEHDGHWKGPNSGMLDNFIYAGRVWILQANSVYVRKFKGDESTIILGPIVDQMARGLYAQANDDPLPDPPPVPPVNLQGLYAVSVRTTHLTKPAAKNVFARIRVGAPGQLVSYDEAAITRAIPALSPPAWAGWWTIHFVDANVNPVHVVYELREQLKFNPKNPIILDIDAPAEGETLSLTGQPAPNDVVHLTYYFADNINNGNPALLQGQPPNPATRVNYTPPTPPPVVPLNGGAQSVQLTVTHAQLR